MPTIRPEPIPGTRSGLIVGYGSGRVVPLPERPPQQFVPPELWRLNPRLRRASQPKE